MRASSSALRRWASSVYVSVQPVRLCDVLFPDQPYQLLVSRFVFHFVFSAASRLANSAASRFASSASRLPFLPAFFLASSTHVCFFFSFAVLSLVLRAVLFFCFATRLFFRASR
nr:hypothetical protein [Proteus mirabilis]